jgi:hypothetical protein
MVVVCVEPKVAPLARRWADLFIPVGEIFGSSPISGMNNLNRLKMGWETGRMLALGMVLPWSHA